MRNLCAGLFLALALFAFADDAAIDALVAQLGADDAAARDAAEKKLIEMGPAAEPRLREREKSAEPEAKARIARAIEGIEAGKIATTDFEPIRLINVGHASIQGAVWTPDGKQLLTAGGSGDIRTWDAATGKLLSSFRVEGGFAAGLALAGDPNRLWISTFMNVVCWDIAQAKAVKTFPAIGCLGVHAAPGGKRVVWKSSGDVQIVNVETLEVEHSIPVGDDMFMDSIGFSPDGTRLAIELRHHIAIFDIATGQRDEASPLRETEYEGSIMSLGVLASGEVVVVNREGLIRWGSHKVTGRAYCWELAVSPDGKRFAVAGEEPVVRVLDADGKELTTFPMGPTRNGGLAWSPDGKRLAAGNDYGRLAIWTDGSREPLELAGHSESPERAVFSPDSSMVAACIGGLGTYWTTFVDIESGRAVDVKGLFGVEAGRSGTEFLSTEQFNVVEWDGKTGKRSGTPLEGKGGARREKAYASPDGTLAWTEGYMVSPEKRFHSFTDKPAPVVTGACGSSWSTAVWSGDSEFVAISGILDFHGDIGSLTVVRRDGTVEFRAEYSRAGGAPCWTPDGRKLFWSHRGDLFVFDRGNFKEPVSSKLDCELAGFLDADRAIGVREKGEEERELVLIHIPTMRVARVWPLPAYGRASVSPDRRKIMVISQEGAQVMRVVDRGGK